MDRDSCLDNIIGRYAIQISSFKDDFIRLCFVLNEAYWLYADFYANEIKVNLSEKEFLYHMFARCSILQEHLESFDQKYGEYMLYKSKIPVYGAILLDSSFT